MTDWIPAIAVVLATIVVIALVRAIINRRGSTSPMRTVDFRRQAWTVGLVILGVLTLVLVLPEQVDNNLAFSVIGLVVTGALAISGQSIIANGMAGIMLRTIKNFRPGDFIEVGEHMGRVSDMGLFHTEIQSADRDLITLPNAMMVNEPVKVVRSSGTIVSVKVGLGYDLSRHRLKELFVGAAQDAGLEDPFVQVTDLGDFAVTYRVAGFLADPTKILAMRSRLRETILDTMNSADVEIMSPMYVARRAVTNDLLIPDDHRPRPSMANRPTAEDKVFDKAELAARIETLREQVGSVREHIETLEAAVSNQEGDRQARTQARVDAEKSYLDRLADEIQELEASQATDD